MGLEEGNLKDGTSFLYCLKGINYQPILLWWHWLWYHGWCNNCLVSLLQHFIAFCPIQPLLIGRLYVRTPQIVPSCLLEQEPRDFLLDICHVFSKLEQTIGARISVLEDQHRCIPLLLWASEFFLKIHLFSIKISLLHLAVDSMGEKRSSLKHFVRVCYTLHRTAVG